MRFNWIPSSSSNIEHMIYLSSKKEHDRLASDKFDYALLVLIAGFAFSVFYFSWIKDSSLHSESWILPQWLLDWCNYFPNARTAVPFLFLGFLTALYLYKKYATVQAWIIAYFILVSLVVIAELGQLFIPTRYCDWRDMLWGAAGDLPGFSLWGFLFIRRGRKEHWASHQSYKAILLMYWCIDDLCINTWSNHHSIIFRIYSNHILIIF